MQSTVSQTAALPDALDGNFCIVSFSFSFPFFSSASSSSVSRRALSLGGNALGAHAQPLGGAHRGRRGGAVAVAVALAQ